MRRFFSRDGRKASWLKTLEQRVSSGVMIIEDKSGRALVVKANYKDYWTFPGGLVDGDETPKQAAIRETQEEVGIKVTPRDVAFVAVIDRKSNVAQTYQFVFTVQLEQEPPITLQKAEIDEYAWVTKADAKAGDRIYGKVVQNWAQGVEGYSEHLFTTKDNLF